MTVRLPNEKVGILQGAARSLIERDWYRWFKSTDGTVSTMAENYVFAAYGIEQYSGVFPDLGAAYQPLIFDNIPLTPRGISFDLVANTITIENPGVYSFDLSGTFSHTKDNTIETTFIRAFDVTAGTPGISYPIILQAQLSATPIARSILIDMLGGEVYRLEIGGGDVVTNIEFFGLIARIYNVGEWRGLPF